MKIPWKKYFLSRLYAVGFVLAVFGWLMLFIFIFGRFFVQELGQLEGFLQSNGFIWGTRIFVIALVIFLFKGKELIADWLKNPRLMMALRVFYIGGGIGWIWTMVALI